MTGDLTNLGVYNQIELNSSLSFDAQLEHFLKGLLLSLYKTKLV
jgi:hypothetical protein